jgi:hypothetical protein
MPALTAILAFGEKTVNGIKRQDGRVGSSTTYSGCVTKGRRKKLKGADIMDSGRKTQKRGAGLADMGK